tara:strand:+ start:264 stop:527 length:264 start_codon:yes stop_codon:yes gene_type:complete
MANIKSAKKRILQNLRRSEINKSRKSKIKGSLKNISLNLKQKKIDLAKKEFMILESNLSKAASKGFYKKNTASRIVSRISSKIKAFK